MARNFVPCFGANEVPIGLVYQAHCFCLLWLENSQYMDDMLEKNSSQLTPTIYHHRFLIQVVIAAKYSSERAYDRRRMQSI